MTERKAVRGRTRRRLIAVAALGVLAVGALAGCRSEPGTAAFVGNTRISDADVDSVVEHATDQDLQNCRTADGDLSACRREVLTSLVFIQIAHQYLADHANDPQFSKDGDPVGAVQKAVQDAENSGQVNRDDPFQVNLATTSAYYQQMRSNLTPAKPTEDQYHEMYDNLVAQGVTDTYPDVRKQLVQIDVGQGIAFQNLLTDAIKKYDVEISPRYTDTPVLGQKATAADQLAVPAVVYQDPGSGRSFVLTAVSLSGGANSPAVVRLPSPAASGGARS